MNIVKIATHDGTFHADEVFALAVLKIYFEAKNQEIQIVRTRDLDMISDCQIVVDVGSKYDHKNHIYDHHQKEKPGKHKNGIPYASFGLIWKHFGRKLTTNRLVHEIIERKVVCPIDALDNGISVSTPITKGVVEYAIAQTFSAICAHFGDEKIDEAFQKSISLAEIILKGEMIKAEEKIKGEKAVTKEIKKQGNPDILLLDQFQNWEAAVSKSKNIKLVIFPDRKPDRWCIQTARDDLDIFGSDRISFPNHWRGLANIELVNVSEVPDSVFCHTGGFFAVTKTKDSAILLAQKAINLSK